jgi:hypothetical protein
MSATPLQNPSPIDSTIHLRLVRARFNNQRNASLLDVILSDFILKFN